MIQSRVRQFDIDIGARPGQLFHLRFQTFRSLLQGGQFCAGICLAAAVCLAFLHHRDALCLLRWRGLLNGGQRLWRVLLNRYSILVQIISRRINRDGIRALLGSLGGLLAVFTPLVQQELTVIADIPIKGSDSACIHQQQTIRSRFDQVHIVADHDDRPFVIGQGLNQGLSGIDVQMVGRLIQQQQLRAAATNHRQGHTGLFATG